MKEDKIYKIRHSLAHILAKAVKELWPNVKLAIGPVINNGFYYDLDFASEKIGEEDLKKIEKKMKHLIKTNLKFESSELTVADALKREKAKQEKYKVELIEDLKAKGEKKVTYYQVGDFIDLCKGPHVENTKEINPQAFTLNKVSGAYWRGDEKKEMLTRIYGLAFEKPEELIAYQEMLKEAEKRDHRKIGKDLDLFHIDDKVGLGLPLWHPKGAILWREIENFWENEHLKADYELVRSPHVGSRKLWETSGHWGFYSDSMYPSMEASQSLEDKQRGIISKEPEEYLLKPMNCPFHVQIYKNSLKSYRDLPIRWAESGTVYRFEKKGELSGLTRVRGFTQDDAHIICTKEQVEDELKRVIDFILYMFKSFGFSLEKINIYLSLRDPKDSKKYAGDDAGWKFTENVLRKVANDKKLNFVEEIGEAAFYGPKLDFKIKDVLEREWQCSTLQFDFNLPKRFNMTYINNHNEEERPYMLHRALLGSYERFIALLIEHYGGAFPLWLSPTQVQIISVGEKHIDFAKKIKSELKNLEIRSETDISDETVGNKIRKAVTNKIPYILVIGDKEMKGDTLTVRKRGEKETTEIKKNDFISLLKKEISQKK
jgi:threonyl-tRNA synthetase